LGILGRVVGIMDFEARGKTVGSILGAVCGVLAVYGTGREGKDGVSIGNFREDMWTLIGASFAFMT
jgi:hypothetical protein